jgi:hypothetical protein
MSRAIAINNQGKCSELFKDSGAQIVVKDRSIWYDFKVTGISLCESCPWIG